MKYIGHSQIYYHGSNGYCLKQSDDKSFFSIYFDCSAFDSAKVMVGVHGENYLFVKRLKNALDEIPYYEFDLFVGLLIEDLDKTFKIKIERCL